MVPVSVSLIEAASNSTLKVLAGQYYYPYSLDHASSMNRAFSVSVLADGTIEPIDFLESASLITGNDNDISTAIGGVLLDGATSYICGGADVSGVQNPAIWTNGSLSLLDMGGGSQGYVARLFVYGGSLYAAGYVYDSSVGWKTVVWQDGLVVQEILDQYLTVSGFHVDSSGVYVCGNTLDESYVTLAILYKDGIELFAHTPASGGMSAATSVTAQSGSIFMAVYLTDGLSPTFIGQIWQIDPDTGSLLSLNTLSSGDYIGDVSPRCITYGPDGNEYVAGDIYFAEFFLPEDENLENPLSGSRPAVWVNGSLQFPPYPPVFGSLNYVRVGY
jgi:hypothetical protein